MDSDWLIPLPWFVSMAEPLLLKTWALVAPVFNHPTSFFTMKTKFYVEDEPFLRKVVRKLLNSRGLWCTPANWWKQGDGQLCKFQPENMYSRCNVPKWMAVSSLLKWSDRCSLNFHYFSYRQKSNRRSGCAGFGTWRYRLYPETIQCGRTDCTGLKINYSC